MIYFILGISICGNIFSIFGFILIYRYSVKGMLNKIEKDIFKGYDDIDISSVTGGVKNDN